MSFLELVKRSQSIRLVLLGGLSAGVLVNCSPQRPAAITSNNVYTNNFYVAGVGYYHAPFRAWYPLPYNYFDPRSQRYFYGGQWAETPDRNVTNASAPSVAAAQQAEAQRADVDRGGFGCTGSQLALHT